MSRQDDIKNLSVAELEHLLEVKRRSELLRRASDSASPPQTGSISSARPQPIRRYQSKRLRPEPGHRTTREITAAEPEQRFRSMALAQIVDPDQKVVREEEERKGGWERARDRLLLLIEVAAVMGLIALIVGGALQLRFLNQETAEAMSASTPPREEVQILPGSSRPPTPAPVPGIYERLIRRTTPVVVPTPGVQSPARIVIEKIGVDAPIVQGDGWEELKKGVGHHIGSANPGTRGNMVLSGHDDVFGEVFRYLDKLEVGDVATVHTKERAFRYVVKGKRIVEPTEVSVMEHTHEPTVTLITCYPYRVDTHRLVIFAELGP